MFFTVGATRAADITVFAAASLRGALDEIAQTTAQDVAIAYGGSGQMARQLALGAPADVVILAHPRWMEWLQDQGLVTNADTLLTNRLVLIGANGPPFDPDPDTLTARLDGGRLAMGQRDAVPAGLYARAWLQTIDAWDTLEPHLAETENVRAALALVARGEAPLGIVYASDARAEPRVQVLHDIPATDHPAIRYPMAVLTPQGADFATLLQSQGATAIFAAHGFGRPAP